MIPRNSKKRQQILDMLKHEHGALSAADIHARLPDLNLTTIYRNLEFFVTSGEVKKLLLTGKEALYEYHHESHHHAVCTDCERIVHFTAPDEELKKLLGVSDFDVQEIEVTVRGKCTK